MRFFALREGETWLKYHIFFDDAGRRFGVEI